MQRAHYGVLLFIITLIVVVLGDQYPMMPKYSILFLSQFAFMSPPHAQYARTITKNTKHAFLTFWTSERFRLFGSAFKHREPHSDHASSACRAEI